MNLALLQSLRSPARDARWSLRRSLWAGTAYRSDGSELMRQSDLERETVATTLAEDARKAA